jgi:UDP-N-acetylmuramoyl-tripeptide--D-alanyl-D-alanine ligase
MEIKQLHDNFLECQSFSTDTRKIEKNSMFFALKGDSFDANTFTIEAFEKGAKFVVIDNPAYYIDSKTILVKDVLKTLQELATYHRNHLGLPIIALTGSNGKTTTKELINVVLSKKFKTKATVGNLNNHIGVPLTLLSFNKETEIGIVEMGANHQKEIEFLCAIAQPDFGYITNFGKAHLEGFGGVEGVIKGKSEMYTYLFNNKKVVFINEDDTIQKNKTLNYRLKYSFSKIDKKANVFIDSIDANPFVKIETTGVCIQSNLIGLYNANNITAAITIGSYFKVPLLDCKDAIESYVPKNNRSQLISKGTNEIILDAYNANPSSMIVALENFLQLEKVNKLIIIGDMYELGEESLMEHNIIVSYLKDKNSLTYFIGKNFYSNKVTSPFFQFFATFEELSNHLEKSKPENKFILIKGSRGMALERTLEFI